VERSLYKRNKLRTERGFSESRVSLMREEEKMRRGSLGERKKARRKSGGARMHMYESIGEEPTRPFLKPGNIKQRGKLSMIFVSMGGLRGGAR